MPDYPQTGGGASAADVWSYSDRKLTNLSDARAGYIDRLANMEAHAAPAEGAASFGTGDVYPKTVTLLDTSGSGEPGENGKMHLVEGYVDLSPLAGSEALEIIESMKIASGGSALQYADTTYTGTQAVPLLHVTTKPARYGLKLDLKMSTAPAANRTFTYQLFKKPTA